MMASEQERLERAVHNAHTPIFRESKADIIEHYKDTYGRNWTSKIAAAVSGTSDTKSKEYKAAIRQFQAGRDEKAPRQKGILDKFKNLGKSLPPIGKRPPKNGFKVTFQGKVKISEGRKDKKGRQRGDGWARANFSIDITGNNAIQFAHNPTYGQVFTDYFTNFQDMPVTDFQVYSIVVQPL